MGFRLEPTECANHVLTGGPGCSAWGEAAVGVPPRALPAVTAPVPVLLGARFPFC